MAHPSRANLFPNYVSQHSQNLWLASTQPATPPAAPVSMEQQIEASLAQYFTTLAGTLPAPGLYDRVLAQLERPLIQHTLRATGGNQIKAAEILGINRNTLRKKMRLLGIGAKSNHAE